ncbi:MAG: methionyl-tRNA formyltransferase, partial [Acidobacteria bacterium]|nr:methionyl-tRNA formyltransferase [Acidobacteriota bacterium]
MMGTGPFAVPTFRALLATRHSVVLLVTQPRRSVRGRRDRSATPMRDVAVERDVPIFDPENVNQPEACAQLRRHEADLLIVADYGQILSRAALAAAGHGGINLHASLLPKYRGAAPVNWALYHGETRTGVTVIQMTRALDAGPAVAQSAVDVEPQETAEALESRLAGLAARLVVETIDAVEAGTLRPLTQDNARATRAPRLKKSDG